MSLQPHEPRRSPLSRLANIHLAASVRHRLWGVVAAITFVIVMVTGALVLGGWGALGLFCLFLFGIAMYRRGRLYEFVQLEREIPNLNYIVKKRPKSEFPKGPEDDDDWFRRV